MIIFFKYVLLKTLRTIYFNLIEMDDIDEIIVDGIKDLKVSQSPEERTIEGLEGLTPEDINRVWRFVNGFYSTIFNEDKPYCSKINPEVNGPSFMMGLNLQRRNGRPYLIEHFGVFFDPNCWESYGKNLLKVMNTLEKEKFCLKNRN